MVAITFRTDGAWGSGLGFNLTNVQVDTNFYNLKLAVEALVAAPPTAVSIESFEVIGTSLYIHMTDSSVEGPFTLPSTSYQPTGVWLPSTHYFVNNLVSNAGTLYIVTFEHDSDTVFDPGANDGAGHDYYQVFFEAPETAFPVGGTTGQVLGKLSDTDFDFTWLSGLAPSGGTAGQLLAKASNTNYDFEYVDPETVAAGGMGLVTTPKTSSNYNLAVGEEFTYQRINNGASQTVTVPNNTSQPFAVDTEITLRQLNDGPGAITIAPASGVTLNKPSGFQAKMLGKHATATVKKINTNEWDLFGLLLPI